MLLLDNSAAMAGTNIASLNEGLRSFKEELLRDELASKRVDVAAVVFGGAAAVANVFHSVEDFEPFTLEAEGPAAMGAGIQLAIDLLEQRQQFYRDQGIDRCRPWLLMIAGGAPADMTPGDEAWRSVIERLHGGEAAGVFSFFAVGVDRADMDLLKMIAPPSRPPVRLNPGKWRELFRWLASRLAADGSSASEGQGPGWGMMGLDHAGLASLHERAAGFIGSGQYEEAIGECDRAVALDPDDAEALMLRGQAHFGLQKNEEAIADFNRVIKIRPEDANGCLWRGRAFARLGQCERALADFGGAIALRLNDPEAYMGRGACFDALGQRDRALADFERAVEIAPDRAGEVIALYDRIIERDPNWPPAHMGRGSAHAALKQYEQAIADYDRALYLDPGADPWGKRAAAVGLRETQEAAERAAGAKAGPKAEGKAAAPQAAEVEEIGDADLSRFLSVQWERNPRTNPYGEVAKDMRAFARMLGHKEPEGEWKRFLQERPYRAERWRVEEYAEALRQVINQRASFRWAEALHAELCGNFPVALCADLHYAFALCCAAQKDSRRAWEVLRLLEDKGTPYWHKASESPLLKPCLAVKAKALADALRGAQTAKVWLENPPFGEELDKGPFGGVLDALLSCEPRWVNRHFQACLTVYLRLLDEDWPDELFRKMAENLPPPDAVALYNEWASRCKKLGMMDRAKEIYEKLSGRRKAGEADREAAAKERPRPRPEPQGPKISVPACFDPDFYGDFLCSRWNKDPKSLRFPEVAEEMRYLPVLFSQGPSAWRGFFSERGYRAQRWGPNEYSEALRQAVLKEVPFETLDGFYDGEVRAALPPNNETCGLHYAFALYCETENRKDRAIGVLRLLKGAGVAFRKSADQLAALEEWLVSLGKGLEKALAAAKGARPGEPADLGAVEDSLRRGAFVQALEILSGKGSEPWTRGHFLACLTAYLRAVEAEWPDELFNKLVHNLPPAEAEDLYYEWALRCEKRGLVKRAVEIYRKLGGRQARCKDVAVRLTGLETISKDESALITRYTMTQGKDARAGAAAKDRAAPKTGEPLGTLAGRYEYLCPLGRGGMGYVFKARDLKLRRMVAIKRMLVNAAPDSEEARRFKEEARLVASLESPYIVGIIDLIEDQDTIFLVLNFVDGETLAELLVRHDCLAPKVCNGIMWYVAAALQMAHEQGVIHRDVKPANIMRDKRGQIKIMDFGIARHVSETMAGPSGGMDTVVAGTPLYMAPEQYAGHSTPKTDVYSLGMTAYEMLAGRPPFDGPDSETVQAQKLMGEYPPLGERVPVALRTLIASMLKVRQEERPDMAQVLRELKAMESA